MAELKKLNLGEKLTVRTMPGRDDTVISRLQDGRVILFDQNSKYFDMIAPGQSVECSVIVITENYVIVSPVREPEEAVVAHYEEIEVEDIIEELEELVEKLSGNAEIIPRALLRVIQLEQLIIRILKGEA
jgi:hypothetical protein